MIWLTTSRNHKNMYILFYILIVKVVDFAYFTNRIYKIKYKLFKNSLPNGADDIGWPIIG